MADEPRTLKSLFREAEDNRHALESAYEASSPHYKDALATAIRDYEACLSAIRAVSLFSPNESLDDIPTPNLPYLLVNYRLAELIEKTSAPSPHDRAAILGRARSAYEQFLGLLDSYDALSETNTRLFARYTDEPLTFSTTGPADGDPTARRNAKIANFRAEKDLKARLQLLRSDPRYGGGGEDGEDDPDADDEHVRALHLANLAYCAHLALQGLEGLNREQQVLAQATVPLMPQATSVEQDERDRRRRSVDVRDGGYSERLDKPLVRLQSLFGQGNSGPILARDGKPLQPFTLVGTRQELQRGVFRPGHNLPTMSIDEYLDEERRRGNIIEGGGEASYARPEPDEDNMEKADAETMAARKWDEFTEANPRGAGNTLNRG